MTVAERNIIAKKMELKKLNNTRLKVGPTEYRIMYEGGVGEYIALYERKNDNQMFRFADGFNAYSMTKDEALRKAKEITVQRM